MLLSELLILNKCFVQYGDRGIKKDVIQQVCFWNHTMKMRCYTDASYCPKTKFAVCGYYIPALSKSNVTFTYLENVKNTEAEVRGLIELLDVLDGTGMNCDVFTDCESAIAKIQSRSDETSSFKRIYDILDNNPFITIKYIQGHKPKNQKTEIDLEFAVVDKAVRKELRKQRKLE